MQSFTDQLPHLTPMDAWAFQVGNKRYRDATEANNASYLSGLPVRCLVHYPGETTLHLGAEYNPAYKLVGVIDEFHNNNKPRP